METNTVAEGKSILQPTLKNEKIQWQLVSKEFRQRFYQLWQSARSSEWNQTDVYWLLDTLGWMINDHRFTQQTTFKEALEQVLSLYEKKSS